MGRHPDRELVRAPPVLEPPVAYPARPRRHGIAAPIDEPLRVAGHEQLAPADDDRADASALLGSHDDPRACRLEDQRIADGDARGVHRHDPVPGWTTTFSPALLASTSNARGASSRPNRWLTSPSSEMRPAATRSTARPRSGASIRRTSWSAISLRRAADAGKVLRSSAGIPTMRTRPPGRTDRTAVSRASS